MSEFSNLMDFGCNLHLSICAVQSLNLDSTLLLKAVDSAMSEGSEFALLQRSIAVSA